MRGKRRINWDCWLVGWGSPIPGVLLASYSLSDGGPVQIAGIIKFTDVFGFLPIVPVKSRPLNPMRWNAAHHLYHFLPRLYGYGGRPSNEKKGTYQGLLDTLETATVTGWLVLATSIQLTLNGLAAIRWKKMAWISVYVCLKFDGWERRKPGKNNTMSRIASSPRGQPVPLSLILTPLPVIFRS